jgi:hypothetical protein
MLSAQPGFPLRLTKDFSRKINQLILPEFIRQQAPGIRLKQRQLNEKRKNGSKNFILWEKISWSGMVCRPAITFPPEEPWWAAAPNFGLKRVSSDHHQMRLTR